MPSDPQVYLVSSRHEGRDSTLVATWILPVTLREDRERVLVALSPGSLTAEIARTSRRLVVQLLSEGQHPFIPRLGLVSGRATDKFADLEIERTSRGLPVVTGTCGWADCDIIAELATSERVVLLCRVVEEKLFSGRRPLRLSQAFKLLSKDDLGAIEDQRQRSGERDQP
jgi:flavin reductase (DIM6/NTAB) family NADH-FMN oxidoreductase RutF